MANSKVWLDTHQYPFFTMGNISELSPLTNINELSPLHKWEKFLKLAAFQRCQNFNFNVCRKATEYL